ncbi:dihydrofolate reductase family protein [Xanthovirga aplysinae]|uniref:dihydrofolate reductase family protein n=1 Tax=Xanthovirga aplysinae TaxID=2529853 RepID=UPI0012BBF94A|nr:dihydrofolate reductase family protein [Xanthovirga aplysinae]MTI32335.1 dihydrofolate reductase [Xanthovirga aplysinae]
MRKIIYYVATSLDGFISGPNDDISGFLQQGKGVEKYQQDLLDFDTVIMGRNTYEFGYKYGLPAGQPAYPHMEHFIFSDSLVFENAHEKVHTEILDIKRIDELKNRSGKDIYLCGGGKFAGWLLDNGKIDVLKLKVNPIILGNGVRLFGPSKTKASLDLSETENFDDGLQIQTFNLK